MDEKHRVDPEVLRRLTSSVTTVQKLLKQCRLVHEISKNEISLLSRACIAGYFELAQLLLAIHFHVEDGDIKGIYTPLMKAVFAGHLDIVQLLVQHGADVNAQSNSGNTPLIYGCAAGHHEVVKYLLDKGANMEDQNENGHTPLMVTANAGHVGVAKILLDKGACINTQSNEFQETALTVACYKGHLDMVHFLLESATDQEHQTKQMYIALMEASVGGHVNVATLLLNRGAPVNMLTGGFKSPLALAACCKHLNLAMLLIEHGANIEEASFAGYTPLMEVAREGYEDVIAFLLSQGANINAQSDKTQETALTVACWEGDLKVADFLIKAGADIELGESTPLMKAAQIGHLDLVRYLLEANANVHAQNQRGYTALTYACENGHTNVADLLLQLGAILEHESEGGLTPLMKACGAGHFLTAHLLLSRGANVRRKTTNGGHTPLSLAWDAQASRAGQNLPLFSLLLTYSTNPYSKLKEFNIHRETFDQDQDIPHWLFSTTNPNLQCSSQVTNSVKDKINNNVTEATQSDLTEQKLSRTEDSLSITDASEQLERQALNSTIDPYAMTMDENINLSPYEPAVESDDSRVEYFAVPNNIASQLPVQVVEVQPFYTFEHNLPDGKSE